MDAAQEEAIFWKEKMERCCGVTCCGEGRGGERRVRPSLSGSCESLSALLPVSTALHGASFINSSRTFLKSGNPWKSMEMRI